VKGGRTFINQKAQHTTER